MYPETDVCLQKLYLCKVICVFDVVNGNGFMITVTNIETLSDH